MVVVDDGNDDVNNDNNEDDDNVMAFFGEVNPNSNLSYLHYRLSGQTMKCVDWFVYKE